MISPVHFLSQGENVSSLLKQIQAGKLTHALLMSGESGIGKWTFAVGIASILLCENEEFSHRPCGKCKACKQVESLSHPDLLIIQRGMPLVPTDVKTVIPVTDIEEMIRRISLQGFEYNGHIVLIRRAEEMNESAQNKLLKTLEEPPANTYFIMTSRNPDLLLPTITSRCRIFRLHPTGEDIIYRILREKGYEESKARKVSWEANGSIGKALKIAEDSEYWQFRTKVLRDFLSCSRRGDILHISTEWKDQKDRADDIFSILESFFSQLMHQAMTVKGLKENDSDFPDRWMNFAKTANAEKFSKLFDVISIARKRLLFSVNFQAVIEQLILSLMEAVVS